MGEVFDSLNTGLKGTAFEPGYVILVAFVALVIWLLTKDKDKENEKRAKEKQARRLAEFDKELHKQEMDHEDDINPWSHPF
ncbi:MAG: hypothetical protein IJI14_19520 [Anaerolineaceae bacterium]|nr:hypothetical protein [Anaerolineaceae bacterium]